MIQNGLLTVFLLIMSNVFMTFACMPPRRCAW